MPGREERSDGNLFCVRNLNTEEAKQREAFMTEDWKEPWVAETVVLPE